MRKLILPFNRLKSTRFPRLHIISLGIACFAVAAVIASCMHADNRPATEMSAHSWSLFSAFSKPTVPEIVEIATERDNRTHLLATFRPEDCLAPQQNWRLFLQSEFGEHEVVVQFSTNPDEHGVLAAVDDSRIFVEDQVKIPADVLSHVCTQAEAGLQQILITDPRVEAQILYWLSKVAPDCQVSVTDGGTWCQMRKLDARVAEDELRSIRMTMIRRWSRQPYILSRRLSVSINLAVALQSADQGRALDTLCRVINISDPVELPLSLSSKPFQKAVCDQTTGNRIASAEVGLTKALDEIELLRQLFEHTSKLGMLAIKIPRDAAPTKDLWVSLTPDESVAELLIEEAAKLSTAENEVATTVEEGESPTIKGCWHPLFSGQKSGQLEIANHLDLAGRTTNISCTSMQQNKEQRTYRYLADSITSETEFVITNGRAKLLRLPNGSYSYKITGHSQTMGWEAIPEESTQGQVDWQGRRPNARISTW